MKRASWIILKTGPGKPLTADMTSAVKKFLARAESSHPLQHPALDVIAGSNLDPGTLYFVNFKGEEINFYARTGINFAMSRYYPSLRCLDIFKGPVCDDIAVFREGIMAILEYARQNRYVFVKMTPQWVNSVEQDLFSDICRNCRIEVIKDIFTTKKLSLLAAEDEIFNSFSPDTRYKIRRAGKDNIRIIPVETLSEMNGFIKLYEQMCTRKSLPAQPGVFFERMYTSLRLKHLPGQIFIASKGKQVLGGAIVLCGGKTAFYSYGAIQRGGNVLHGHLTAGYPLQWHAMRWAKNNGYHEYDLGGYDETMDYGAAHFKKGFNGEIFSAVPGRIFICHNIPYAIGKILGRIRKLPVK